MIHAFAAAAAARSVPFRGVDKVEAAFVAWCITDLRKDFWCLDENFGVGHNAWSLGTKPPGKSGGMGRLGAAGGEELGGSPLEDLGSPGLLENILVDLGSLWVSFPGALVC